MLSSHAEVPPFRDHRPLRLIVLSLIPSAGLLPATCGRHPMAFEIAPRAISQFWAYWTEFRLACLVNRGMALLEEGWGGGLGATSIYPYI